jgi:ankyrin repeat protein
MLTQFPEELNQRDDEGKTVLHYAIDTRQYEVVERLLRKGANVDVRDVYGFSPRDFILQSKEAELNRILSRSCEPLPTKRDEGKVILALGLLTLLLALLRVWLF